MVVLDATALLLLLNEKTSPPRDAESLELIQDAHERMMNLAAELSVKGERIIIAAPVLAELLVRAENAAAGYVLEFSQSARFKSVAFDQKAAIEHAIYTRKAIEDGDKRGGIEESWVKVKFDRQIVAIALAEGAHTIYTDDKNLKNHAEQQGLKVITTGELLLNKQPELFDKIPPAETETAAAVAAVPLPEQTDEAKSPANDEIKETPKQESPKEASNGTGDAIVEIAPPGSRP